MKSPFPGMDPYLERHWQDVHSSLVVAARNALNVDLPADLIARAEERVAIESAEDEGPTLLAPDVRVVESSDVLPGQAARETAGIDLAPYRLTATIEPLTERYIEIREADGERLITVIEFLSPSNKRGAGLADFRQKRRTLLAGGVNFVEIDLVRSGDWKRLLAPYRAPAEAQSPYRATVRAFNDPHAVHFHPISLRQPLPSVKIPLRAEDEPVNLPLQPLVDQTYDSGRYGRTLDYTKPLDPPLDPQDAAWTEKLLKSAAGR